MLEPPFRPPCNLSDSCHLEAGAALDRDREADSQHGDPERDQHLPLANHWSLKGMAHVDEPEGVGTRPQLITAVDAFYMS